MLLKLYKAGRSLDSIGRTEDARSQLAPSAMKIAVAGVGESGRWILMPTPHMVPFQLGEALGFSLKYLPDPSA